MKSEESFLSKWIAERKAGPAEMSAEAQQKLGVELVRRLRSQLRPFVTSKFGFPSAEEMASDEVSHIMVRLDENGLSLPDFVVDSRTLFIWLYRSAWSRFCQRMKTTRYLRESGLSGTADNVDDVHALGMQDLAERPFRGAVLTLEQISLDDSEALQVAMRDCDRWFADTHPAADQTRGWRYVFEQVIFNSRDQSEVAAELVVSDGTVSRWVDRGRFCVARRMEFDDNRLRREFGEKQASAWSTSLSEALESRR